MNTAPKWNTTCWKGIEGCLCRSGFNPMDQCEKCRGSITRQSRCVCEPTQETDSYHSASELLKENSHSQKPTDALP